MSEVWAGQTRHCRPVQSLVTKVCFISQNLSRKGHIKFCNKVFELYFVDSCQVGTKNILNQMLSQRYVWNTGWLLLEQHVYEVSSAIVSSNEMIANVSTD